MAIEVVRGRRGAAPRTVTFLSGDVHHSYVSQVGDLDAAGHDRAGGLLADPQPAAAADAVRHRGAVLRDRRAAGRAGGPVGQGARAAVPWNRVKGPWFDNNLATLEVKPDGLEMWWATGEVSGGQHDRPALSRVATVLVGEDGVARSE